MAFRCRCDPESTRGYTRLVNPNLLVRTLRPRYWDDTSEPLILLTTYKSPAAPTSHVVRCCLDARMIRQFLTRCKEDCHSFQPRALFHV